MRINWVVADSTVIAPDVDINTLKDIASIWGSWRTWRGCGTDNVICNDAGKARELLKRNMNEMCNMYVPETMYVELDRPKAVRLFGGKFTFEVDNQDELIAMQLVASQSDIVLLLGFDWTKSLCLMTNCWHIEHTIIESLLRMLCEITQMCNGFWLIMKVTSCPNWPNLII